MPFFPPLSYSLCWLYDVRGRKREKQTIPYLVLLPFCARFRESEKKKDNDMIQQFVAFRSTNRKRECTIEKSRRENEKNYESSSSFSTVSFPEELTLSSSLKSHALPFPFESRNPDDGKRKAVGAPHEK